MENPTPPLPPLKQGDFVRTEWFLVEQTARVVQVSNNQRRVLIWIMPVLDNGKKYNAKLTGIDFYYLQESTKWVDRYRIGRMATAAEIEVVTQAYGLA